MKKKLLYVIPSLGTGGGEKLVLELANNIDYDKFEVYILSYYKQSTNVYNFLLNDKAKIIFLDKKLGLDLSLFSKVKKVVKQINPDIIHAHLDVLLYLIPSFKKSQKKFFTIHNIPSKEATGLQKLVRSFCFKFKGVIPVAISKTLGELAKKYYHYKKDIPVIDNGVSLKKATSNMNHLKSSDDFIMLNVGSFKQQKDHFTLIDAFNKFQKIHANAKLWILGDGVLRNEIENKIKEYNLENKITLFGNVSNVHDYLQSADVFVLSSIFEGFPLCLLEALSESLPIVSTNVGGVCDIIDDGKNGFLVGIKDVDAMVSRCNLLYTNKELRNAISKNALESSYKYDIKECAKKHEEMYLTEKEKKKNKKILPQITVYLSFLISVLGIITSSLYFNKTSDYKFEKLSYDICNYNEVTYLDDDAPTIISLTFNEAPENRNYSSMFAALTNKFSFNKFVRDYRLMSTTPLPMSDSVNGDNYNITILTQNLFFGTKLSENTYAFDYRRYATYNKTDVRSFSNGDFCFVSESLAQKLLKAHNFNVTEENKLIMYDLLDATSSNSLGIEIVDESNPERTFRYHILGVLRSDYRGAPKAQERVETLDSEFMLVYTPFRAGRFFDLKFEVDLKINPNGNKDTFNYFQRYLGDERYNVEFNTLSSENKYVKNDKLTNQFIDACETIKFDKSNNIYAYTFFIISFLIYFILSLINMNSSPTNVFIVFILYVISFVAYGIIANYTFIYPISTLIMLMFILYYTFIERKKIYETICKCFKKFRRKN